MFQLPHPGTHRRRRQVQVIRRLAEMAGFVHFQEGFQ